MQGFWFDASDGPVLLQLCQFYWPIHPQVSVFLERNKNTKVIIWDRLATSLLADACVHVRRCLQEHMDDDAMSTECKEEVQTDQIRSSQDYRYPNPPALPLRWIRKLTK